jgi:membrane protein
MPFNALLRYSWCRRVFRLVVAASEKFQDDLLSLRAMGLTYTTLLSLVPFLAVTFATLKAFGVHNQLEPFLSRAFEPLGPEGGEITRRVVEFVDNLRVGVLGAVGIAALFYTVISLIGEIEDALNCIWQVRRPRSWTHRFRDYLSVVLVGPVFVFTAFALTASAQSHWIVQRLAAITPLEFIVTMTTRIMPFLFLYMGFTLVYWLLPNTRVRLSSALIGGAVAALLWQLAGVGFTTFVATSTRYAAVYSSFAVLILFLLWLYVGWLIVLVGGAVSYFYQYPPSVPTKGRYRKSLQLPGERWALETLAEITKRYLSGQSPWNLTTSAVAGGPPLAQVENFIDACVRRGILIRALEPEGVSLARPPEQVALSEIFALLRDRDATDCTDNSDDPVSQALSRQDHAVRRALTGMTLKSLVAGANTNVVEAASVPC